MYSGFVVYGLLYGNPTIFAIFYIGFYKLRRLNEQAILREKQKVLDMNG